MLYFPGTILSRFTVHCFTISCRYFAEEIDLGGLQIDVALRHFQSFFRMPVSYYLSSLGRLRYGTTHDTCSGGRNRQTSVNVWDFSMHG